MAYGPQSVSLTQSGGDLDLLEALRGGRSRAKTQQEMLREQSMSPVEIGSYNGIQGKFPISQGINKIAQGLLATYMDSQARDRAQAAADAQKDEAQKYAAGFAGAPAVAGVNAVLPERGTVAGPVVDGVDPETPEAANSRIVMDQLRRNQPGQEGVDYRATAPVSGMPGQRLEAAPGQGDTDDPGVVGRDAVAAQPGTGPTPAQRTAMLLQGMASSNPAVNRMATLLGNQDAEARLQKDRLDDRGFQAEQQHKLIAANRDIKSAETRKRAEEDAIQAGRLKNEQIYTKNAPIFAKADAGFTAALAYLDTTTNLIRDITNHPSLDRVVAPRDAFISLMPTVTAKAEELQQKIKQLKATGSLNVLQELKKSGASLGVVSNADAERLDRAFSSLSLTTNPTIFKNELKRIQTEVDLMRGRIAEQHGHAQQYNQSLYDRTQDPTAKLYKIPLPTPTAPPAQAPQPANAPGDDPKPLVPSASLPQDALAILEEGKLTEFGNGQVWTKRNGNPVRVR